MSAQDLYETDREINSLRAQVRALTAQRNALLATLHHYQQRENTADPATRDLLNRIEQEAYKRSKFEAAA